MVKKLGLITEDTLFDKIGVPTTSATTNVAKFLKIGDTEYKINGESSVFFELQLVGGVPKAEYDLTDAQVAEFSDAEKRYLVLRTVDGGMSYDQLLTTRTRASDKVVFEGGDKVAWEFSVVYATKKGTFASNGAILTGTEIVSSLIVPSETTAPTKYATSIKFNDTNWGFNTTDCVKKAGDTMTGPLTLGDASYITGGTSVTLKSQGDLPMKMVVGLNDVEIGRVGALLQVNGIEKSLRWNMMRVLTEGYIEDNLTTETSGKILDARQGKLLSDSIATKQDKLVQAGASNVPIYVEADGTVHPGDVYAGGTCLSVNGAGKGGQSVGIYAPLVGGDAGQVLISGGTASPVWKGIVNDLTSTATDQPLSAAQGKALGDRIQSLETLGRFLSIWNASTGLPMDNPSTSPYVYKVGDYYRVGTVAASGGTNYKPNGTEYVTGTASTTVESGTLKSGDVYVYTGTGWQLSAIAWPDVSFLALSGSPDDNTALTAKFSEYLPVAGGIMTGNLVIAPTACICGTTPGSLNLQATAGLGVTGISVTDTGISMGTGIGTAFVLNSNSITWGGSPILTKSNVVNDLTTGGTDVPLSAEQGKVLVGMMPKFYRIAANTTTIVSMPNNNGMFAVGGNLVAIGLDTVASAFVINGVQVASGTAVSIGSATLTVTSTADGFTILSTVAGIFVG